MRVGLSLSVMVGVNHASAVPLLLLAFVVATIVAPVAPALADAPQVLVTGVVFADLNADGVRDPDEPGLSEVRVSNGIDVTTSDQDGQFTTTVTRDDSRMVLLTVPRGYRATRGFYHRVGAGEADSVAFGLAADPAADRDRFRFVHASDPHVFDAAGAADFTNALGEMAALDPPVDFVVITGDLVNTGTPAQLGHVAGALAGPPLPVHAGFGDHDADQDSLLVRTFESLIGPTYYSFDRGPYHFVLYNDVRSASYSVGFRQQLWLANDIAATPADRQILVFTHFQPDRREMDLYRSLGVDAVLSGHWHANRTTVIDGILNLNTGTLRMGGIDRTSRGFRVVELDHDAIAAARRTGGIAPRLTIVDPPAGVAPVGRVAIRAMGYATSETVLAARYTVTGPDGVAASGDLVAEGGWSYSGTWDAGAALPGSYEIAIDLIARNGILASGRREILLENIMLPGGTGGENYASFRGDPGGSGRVVANLELPLRVAWSRHVGGPSELASPVIADERVIIAYGAASDPGPVGLVALDLATGAELWRYATDAEVKGTPAVDGGLVYAITSVGTVIAVAAESGALAWSTPLGDPADRYDVTSPLVDQGVVYAGGPARTAALDALTGAVLWARTLGEDWFATIYSAPVADPTRVVLGLNSGLFVLDRATGATVWSREANGRETHRSPALVDGVLYAAGDTFGSQRLRAFAVASGAELWSAPYPAGNSNSAPAVGDSAVVLGTGYGTLEAFARSDGRSLWSFGVGAPIASGRPYSATAATVTASPLIAGGAAYFGADDGKLYAVDMTTGTLVWSADLGAPLRSSPAASGSFLIASTVDGTLFAFAGGEPTPAGIGGDATGAPGVRSSLGPVAPNPFIANGAIPVMIAGAGGGAGSGGAAVAVETRLDVIDVGGRRVRTLLRGPQSPGRHAVRWDGRDHAGRDVASGVYFLRLAAGAQVATARLTLVR
jgi:outer membrane protein assembly factor BamB/predicted phosphodiesterase